MKKVVPLNVPHRIQRGDNPVTTVQTYEYAGGTVVHICDDYIATTDEEREQVDAQVAAAGWAIIDELMEMGEAV